MRKGLNRHDTETWYDLKYISVHIMATKTPIIAFGHSIKSTLLASETRCDQRDTAGLDEYKTVQGPEELDTFLSNIGRA